MTAAVVLVKMKKMIQMNKGYTREDTLLLSKMFYDTTE